MDTIKLNENSSIPIIGLGTWQLTRDVCQRAVEDALEIGYRMIDTADKYSNHAYIAKAIKNSKVKRKDLFITTKVWRGELTYEHVVYAGERFLDELEIDYIDLLLIHWPNKEIDINETLKAFEKLKSKKIIKAYGVSNFSIENLKKALNTKYQISINQFELHPSFYQKDLVSYCKDNNVNVIAYSPNGMGQDLDNPLILSLSKKYQKTPSQIILNWILEKGIIVIPRSKNKNHLKENYNSYTFRIEKDDLKKIDSIGGNNRIVNPTFSEF